MVCNAAPLTKLELYPTIFLCLVLLMQYKERRFQNPAGRSEKACSDYFFDDFEITTSKTAYETNNTNCGFPFQGVHYVNADYSRKDAVAKFAGTFFPSLGPELPEEQVYLPYACSGDCLLCNFSLYPHGRGGYRLSGL
jgi:hypothetical protein